jgi:hypothetical protein
MPSGLLNFSDTSKISTFLGSIGSTAVGEC